MVYKCVFLNCLSKLWICVNTCNYLLKTQQGLRWLVYYKWPLLRKPCHNSCDIVQSLCTTWHPINIQPFYKLHEHVHFFFNQLTNWSYKYKFRSNWKSLSVNKLIFWNDHLSHFTGSCIDCERNATEQLCKMKDDFECLHEKCTWLRNFTWESINYNF